MYSEPIQTSKLELFVKTVILQKVSSCMFDQGLNATRSNVYITYDSGLFFNFSLQSVFLCVFSIISQRL